MEAIRYQPRYTVEDYERWEGDWELWDGVAVAMSPSSNFRHQRLAFALAKLIDEQIENNEDCHCQAVYEHDWRISATTVVRPDILVVCDPFEGEWVNVTPALIVEVTSAATAHKDRTAKRDLYEAMGVRHYLLVEPSDGSVEVLTLIDGSYRPAARDASAIAHLELHDGCRVRVPARVEA